MIRVLWSGKSARFCNVCYYGLCHALYVLYDMDEIPICVPQVATPPIRQLAYIMLVMTMVCICLLNSHKATSRPSIRRPYIGVVARTGNHGYRSNASMNKGPRVCLIFGDPANAHWLISYSPRFPGK